MRSQKLLSVFLLLLFFVPGVLFALSGGWQTLTLPSAASIWDGTAAQWTENILAESFAGKDFLCSAAAALQTALPALQSAADNALHRAHSAQPAHLRLERFAFAARDYGGFALPGGEYTALRIELGGAQGRNWFCVLYPALCLSGAQSDYPTKAENALVFGRYEVRWAVKDAVMQIINKK